MTEAIKYEMELEGLKELDAIFASLPSDSLTSLKRAAWEASLLFEREVKEVTPVGVGGGAGLKGSIASQEPVIAGNNVIAQVGTSSPHAVPVELGTKPHMPPVTPLVDWAEQKLGLSPEEAKSVGFAIARKIARKGTEGQFMFKKTFEATETQIEAIFSKAVREIVLAAGGTS